MDRMELIFGALPMLAYTEGDHWRLGIGDPTAMGWFTVFAYVGAALLCWRAAQNNLTGQKVRAFWMALAGVLFLLGINKQLDLQTALTFLGKDLAKATGWYEHRRTVQAIFIALMGIVAIAGTVKLFSYFRPELPRLWQALAGIGFLLCFIVVRAASFHHMDQFLNFAPAGIRLNWVLELAGIAAIAWPAWRAKQQSSETGFIWVSGGGARGPLAGAKEFKALRAHR